jgi:tetratricopeptide (TPR) repeat protein
VEGKNMQPLNLDIQKHNGDYRLNMSSPGFKDETYFIPSHDINGLLSRCTLIDSYLACQQADRFAGDFIGIGREIFRLFFLPYTPFSAVTENARSQAMAVFISVSTEDQAITGIPWELVYGEEHGFLAVSPQFQIIRTAKNEKKGNHDENTFSPGPLRILFMACSPEGSGVLLDYEREEEMILNAVSAFRQKKQLEMDIAESGTLEELTRMLAEKEYHVIHISGHGSYDKADNTGYLSMEKPSGMADPVSAQKLAEALIGFPSVRLLFLAACETGRELAPNTGLARLLNSRGIPMVVAANHSVGDHAMTLMAAVFYEQLTLKRSVSHALQLARKAYQEKYKQYSFQWMIPALFAGKGHTGLVDWKKPLQEIQTAPRPAVMYGKVRHLKTGFRGRRREQREYLKLLRDGAPPALCITGEGGVGKSTLAARLTDRLYHSGYRVIPIYGEMTPDKLIQETIKVFISEKAKEEADYLKGLLDSQEKLDYLLSNVLGTKPTLYLFDNFEDNLKASAGFKEFKNPYWQQAFQTLLEQLPHTESRILITCRYAIPGPDKTLLHQAGLKEMTEPEARKLMVFKEEFAGVSIEQIREIYGTIGGNPKAIGDLGTLLKTGTLTWESLKEKLEHVAKDMREFTLFETLYHLLSEQDRAVFRKISLYQGWVQREALQLQEPDEAVLNAAVQNLLNYSLLQTQDDMIYNHLRYQVHPLDRQHILPAWWEEGEKETAHRNAAQYYRDKKDFDLDSLIHGAQHLRDAGDYNEMADFIADYTEPLYIRGFWDESLYLHQYIIEQETHIEKRFLAAANNNIGTNYNSKGEWDKALTYFLKAEKIWIEIGDRAGLGATYNNTGMIYNNKGEWDKALAYVLKSQKILIEVGDRAGFGSTYNSIGTIYADKGEWDKALTYFLKAEKIWIEVGDRAGLGYAYNNIGMIYSDKGEWNKALTWYLKAEQVRIEIGDRTGLGATYNNIGRIYSKKGAWDKALAYFLKSEQIMIEVGNRAGLRTTYSNIGTIYDEKGEWDKALTYFLKDEQIEIEVGSRAGLGTTYNNIGLTYCKKGELDKAFTYLLKSKKIRIEVGDRAGLRTTYSNIGLLYGYKDKLDKALTYFLKAEQIQIELGDRNGLVTTYFNIGAIYLKKKDKKGADRYLILAGYIAVTQGMKHERDQMAWALTPVIEEMGADRFMAEGRRLCGERGMV